MSVPDPDADEEAWRTFAGDVRVAGLYQSGDEHRSLAAWEPLTQHARNAAWAVTYAKTGSTQRAHAAYPDVFTVTVSADADTRTVTKVRIAMHYYVYVILTYLLTHRSGAAIRE